MYEPGFCFFFIASRLIMMCQFNAFDFQMTTKWLLACWQAGLAWQPLCLLSIFLQVKLCCPNYFFFLSFFILKVLLLMKESCLLFLLLLLLLAFQNLSKNCRKKKNCKLCVRICNLWWEIWI